ncbi:MAG: ABC transporter permease [Microbacteriaceae bacterium]
MIAFIARRLSAAVLVVIAASFIVYVLAAISKDPLEDLRASNDPNKEQLMATRTRILQLDIPPVLRYFVWLRGVLVGNLGRTIENQEVIYELGHAMSATLSLVTAATVLAIIFGIAIGMSSALRQYSGYDYTVTFIMFVLYSLPVFWLAVLLKQYMAIGFNDFLRDPVIEPLWVVILSLLGGFIVMNIVGGQLKQRLTTLASATVVSLALIIYFNASGWLRDPSLGVVGIAIIGSGLAIVVTLLSTGLKNKRVLYISLSMVAVGLAAYYPVQWAFALWQDALMFVVLGLVTLGVGLAAGWFFGGEDRGPAMRTAAITAVLVGFVIVLDRLFSQWTVFYSNPLINGRPISTSGAHTPNLQGSMWTHMVDTFGHLLLPTLALMLISLAGYTRYSRASLLEVMNQDYVRTARAKGLTERTVVMRHAFRNAMIPIATIIAFDVGGLIGGAIITEQVFSWNGMGGMFLHNLEQMDLNPVMGVFLVTGLVAIVFNLIADFSYAALDPRIRVK